jgi:enoyl-CoA hydratase/carnithine racemase
MASSKQAHLHPAQGLLIVRTVYSLTGATMTEFCIVEKADHIMTVRINRPDRLNALHPPGNAELGEVFDDFDADDDMWVAIITGEGRGFSAGNDLRHQAEGGERVATPRGFGGLSSRFDMQKPVIAAVNGVAMGGGFEIALSCDLIIASDKALFALPEPKVGLAALAGGLNRLPRQIGAKRALGMILTGRHVPAEEGYQLGFVNEVVPHDQLMERALEWAAMITACAPLSIRASKNVVYESLSMASLEESMDNNQYESVRTMIGSEDFVEGPLAFSEKRPPNWKGR